MVGRRDAVGRLYNYIAPIALSLSGLSDAGDRHGGADAARVGG
jgi:hypothetical protein